MDPYGNDKRHAMKRVTLPSGKVIEVVYFAEGFSSDEIASPPPEPTGDYELHVCLDCHCPLVHPTEWEEAGPESWRVVLECPNCQVMREGVFTQECVERFDEELDRGADRLAADYRRLMRANMVEEIDRFAGALEADAILPEDFGTLPQPPALWGEIANLDAVFTA